MRTALLSLVLVAIVPLILLQVVVYWEWFAAERESEFHSNSEVAQGVAIAFTAFVRDVSRMGRTITAAADPREPDYLHHAQRVLHSGLSQYPSLSAWYVTDPEGKVISAVRTELIGRTSPAAEEAMPRLRSGRETYVTDLMPQGLRDPNVFAIVRRFEDERRQLAGAIVAEVNPSKLGELAITLQRPLEGRYTLFDRKGIWVFTSPETDVPREAWRARDPLLDEALRGRCNTEGISRLPFDSRPRFAARVFVQDVGWVVGASRPVEVALASARRTLRWVTGLTLLVIAVSAAGTALIGRRIVFPLARLQRQAEAFGRGQLEQRVEGVAIHELAELGAHFNQMAERLQERTETAERAIRNLARSNQELEQFAYVASHDLQEPLRVITGYLQLIERRYRSKLDEDGEQFIAYVIEAVFRMQQLIADLLEYSRVGTRGRPFQPVAMENVFDEVLKVLARSIEESGAVIERGSLPEVVGDPTQLTQLLQNLLGNAIKFRSSRRPEIRVTGERQDGQWRFSVSDNGIGMEPQYWEQIFVIFQRLHTRQKYSGTGIGLAICKRIVERHGGRIWVESVPGQGSTFHFTLSQSPPQEPRASQDPE